MRVCNKWFFTFFFNNNKTRDKMRFAFCFSFLNITLKMWGDDKDLKEDMRSYKSGPYWFSLSAIFDCIFPKSLTPGPFLWKATYKTNTIGPWWFCLKTNQKRQRGKIIKLSLIHVQLLNLYVSRVTNHYRFKIKCKKSADL